MKMFPLIHTINDVLPHIKDRDEFYVASKDGYQVINYHVNLPDTFPAMSDDSVSMETKLIRRECRGIKFNTNGDIICRPHHKFFNLNERDETRMENLSSGYKLFTKFDGSMIAPFYVGSKIIWGTKLGETDASLLAQNFAEQNYNYIEFAEQILSSDHTPIFEWCSPKQRIVINYPKSQLVLTAIRDLHTGNYVSQENMVRYSICFDLPCVFQQPDYTPDQIRNMTGIEGFIMNWPDGMKVKVKTDEYCAIHKAKDNINREKNVLKFVLENKLDDILPHLTDEDRTKVFDYSSKVNSSIMLHETVINQEVAKAWKHVNYNKEDFAYWVKTRTWGRPSFFFSARNFLNDDSKASRTAEVIIKYMLLRTSSQTKVDQISDLINTTWNYNLEDNQ